MNVDFCFSRLRVSYFGSFTQEAGFEMTVSSGKFGVNYQVDVQDVIDDLNLTRRPVANWILRGLHSELDKVTTDLVSNLPETDEQYQGVDDNDVIEIERQTKNYFLFSVKRFLFIFTSVFELLQKSQFLIREENLKQDNFSHFEQNYLVPGARKYFLTRILVKIPFLISRFIF